MYFLLRAPTPISTMWPNPFLYRNTAPWLKPIGFRSALRSDVALTLHTYHAARIWTGRQKSDAKHSILGLSGFCAYVNRMHRGAAQDDPYSDWWLLQIEEKVESCQAALKAIDQRLDDVMAKLPATLDISENLSVTPVKVPLFISNPLGFKAVYLLTNYDELARRILLAQHVGLVGRRDMEVWLDEGASVLRSLFGLAQSYQFSGATRDDFAANNARAEAARKMYESSARSRRTSWRALDARTSLRRSPGAALTVMPMMTLTVSSSRTDRNAAAR